MINIGFRLCCDKQKNAFVVIYFATTRTTNNIHFRSIDQVQLNLHVSVFSIHFAGKDNEHIFAGTINTIT